MKVIKILALTFLCAALCCGCKEKKDEKQGNVNIPSEKMGQETEDKAPKRHDSRPPNEIIAEAMEKTSKLNSFQAVTEGSLKLGGKTINGEFGLKSKIHVVQGGDRQKLQMTMETRINPGDIISKAYYKDGWYYVDDGKEKHKQEKGPKEVLGIVTDITDMVIDASDKIENVRVEEDGTDRIYTYGLPSYAAEDYVTKLLKETGADASLFEDVAKEFESIQFVSRINEEGILTRQEAIVSGELKKAIIVIPVDAKIAAEFTETDDKELKMELW